MTESVPRQDAEVLEPVVSQGESGSGCRELPAFLEAWSLQLDGPPVMGNTAVVQPVRRADESLAVVRIGDPVGDASDGWRALRSWDGDGAVRLHEHDLAQDVSLLERADHTRTLDSLPVSRAVVVAAELRLRHDRRAPDGLRTLEKLAAHCALDLAGAMNVPSNLRERAAAICRELGPGSGQQLVNVDLHFRNVLGASREPWLVIDPMPIAGDREFGLASLLWGRLEEADTMALFEPLVEICRLDRDRARAWTIVEAVVKMTRSSGRVAHHCETVARTLARR